MKYGYRIQSSRLSKLQCTGMAMDMLLHCERRACQRNKEEPIFFYLSK